MFRYLNTSGTGSLTIEEFYGIYDAVMMTWQPQVLDTPWYFTASPTVQKICQTANSIISWPYFDHIFCNEYKFISMIICFNFHYCYFRCFNYFKLYCYD